MASTKYSDMLTDVLPYLAADPSDPVTEYAIRRTVVDFCADTLLWRYIPDSQDVVAGEAYYDLDAPNGGQVNNVLYAKLDGVPLINKSVEWLNANEPRWDTDSGVSKYFTQLDSDQLILALVPDSSYTDGLSMMLSLYPSAESTSFPSWIANQYGYTIALGAVSRLMLMPQKPWTDLAVGSAFKSEYEGNKSNARADAVMALSRASVRTGNEH